MARWTSREVSTTWSPATRLQLEVSQLLELRICLLNQSLCDRVADFISRSSFHDLNEINYIYICMYVWPIILLFNSTAL